MSSREEDGKGWGRGWGGEGRDVLHFALFQSFLKVHLSSIDWKIVLTKERGFSRPPCPTPSLIAGPRGGPRAPAGVGVGVEGGRKAGEIINDENQSSGVGRGEISGSWSERKKKKACGLIENYHSLLLSSVSLLLAFFVLDIFVAPCLV